jgi:hypothetical protein
VKKKGKNKKEDTVNMKGIRIDRRRIKEITTTK